MALWGLIRRDGSGEDRARERYGGFAVVEPQPVCRGPVDVGQVVDEHVLVLIDAGFLTGALDAFAMGLHFG